MLKWNPLEKNYIYLFNLDLTNRNNQCHYQLTNISSFFVPHKRFKYIDNILEIIFSVGSVVFLILLEQNLESIYLNLSGTKSGGQNSRLNNDCRTNYYRYQFILICNFP